MEGEHAEQGVSIVQQEGCRPAVLHLRHISACRLCKKGKNSRCPYSFYRTFKICFVEVHHFCRHKEHFESMCREEQALHALQSVEGGLCVGSSDVDCLG